MREPLAPILAALETILRQHPREAPLFGDVLANYIAAARDKGIVEERQHAGEGTAKRTPDRLALAEQDECHGAANAAVNYDGNSVHSPTWNAAYQRKAAEIRARKSPVAPPVPPQPETRPMLDEVKDCDECPYSYRGPMLAGGWRCVHPVICPPDRDSRGRKIPMTDDGPSGPPPDWCPLRTSATLVRLRAALPAAPAPPRPCCDVARSTSGREHRLGCPADPAPPQPNHYPRPPRDEEEREACDEHDNTFCAFVDARDGFDCTRRPHHKGDHIESRRIDGVNIVFRRRPQSTPPQSHDTRKPIDAAICDLAACYDRMAREERNRDKATVYLRAAADLWRTVDGARGSEKQPHDGERATPDDRVHELKCWPEPFAAILGGRKAFEWRRNDRDYHVGDVLHLREYVAPARGRVDGRASSAISSSPTTPAASSAFA